MIPMVRELKILLSPKCSLRLIKNKQDVYVETKDTIPYVDGHLVEVTDVKFQVMKNGQHVVEEEQKLSELFNNKRYRVKVTGLKNFQIIFDETDKPFIDHVRNLIALKNEVSYLRNGYVKQIKEPKIVSFKSFEECSANPVFPEMMVDFTKMEYNEIMGYIYNLVDSRQNYLQEFNKPWSAQLFEKFYGELTQKFAAECLKTDLARSLTQKFIG